MTITDQFAFREMRSDEIPGLPGLSAQRPPRRAAVLIDFPMRRSDRRWLDSFQAVLAS